MADINKMHALAEVNREMLDAVSVLEDALKKKDEKQLAKSKELILSLQRKTSELLK